MCARLFFALLLGGSSLTPHLARAANGPAPAPDVGPRAAPRVFPVSPCGPTVYCEPPAIDDWPRSTPPPPGYHASSRPRAWAIGMGSALFGVPWLLGGALIALDEGTSKSPHSNLNWLLLPVAGPFVELAYGSGSAEKALLVTDGILQAAGVGLLVLGDTWQVPMIVRNDLGSLRVVPLPTVLGTGGGLSAVGTF